jgi:exodeoxyribonuclease VII large subunit
MADTAEPIYTPSELNREIRLHLETGFPRLLVEGEISNLARPASGHLYFTLKDDRAQLRCAMFRSAAAGLRIRPDNGQQVLARGRISLYEPRGDYQLIVDRIEAAGEGLLQRRFEELKKKLESEGLFDPARKQPLPPYPARIGLITSPSGAAVRDLLHVLARRWPVARVRLYPVPVQGAEAPLQLRRAIEAANRHRWAELLIVGRGGGSLEDLAAFNDENLARAVFASTIPVISAVGHETDFSICDFVADLRAPTPSAAAELAAPDRQVLQASFAAALRQLEGRMEERLRRDAQRLDHAAHRLRQKHPRVSLEEQQRRLDRGRAALASGMRQRLREGRLRAGNLEGRLAALRPQRRLADLNQRVDAAGRSIARLATAALQARRERLQQLARTLHAVSPLETIGRGYAVIRSEDPEAVISSTAQASRGQRITAELRDGHLDCTIDEVHTGKARDP